jgi:hypothetical protein
MKSRPECADCAVDNTLGDGACCPWPNKDDFCKAWTPSQEWQSMFKQRLHEILQRARTWEKKVKEKDFGTLLGMKKTMRVMRQFEKTELFLKEVNCFIGLASKASVRARSVLATGCNRTQEQPR